MRANDSTRRDPVVLAVAGAVLLACCATAAVLERIDPIAPRHFVVWRTPEQARRVALETRRPILFAFVRERDFASSRFEHDLFAGPDLGRRINREFVGVRIVDVSNTGRSNTPFVNALIAQHEVHRLPALVVSDAEGTRFETLARHRGRAETVAFLNHASRRVYEPKAGGNEAARQAYITALATIGGASSPSLSPDGTRVAFVSDLSGQPQLWVMDVEGGFPQLVTSMEDGVNAAQWSPDGRWIALASGVKASQIYVVRPDGRDLRQITNGSGRNVMTFWTNSNRLPVNTARRTTRGMESSLYDPETNTSRVVATHPQFGVLIDVSCDGRRSILVRRDGARRSTVLASGSTTRELFVHGDDEQTVPRFASCTGQDFVAVTNRGRDKNALVRIRGNVTAPLWSRDDAELSNAVLTNDRQRAALVWNRAGSEELALIDLRTGRREIVPLPVRVIGGLAFSSDGSKLVFAGSDSQRPFDIWVLDVETNSVRQLTRTSHAGVDLGKLSEPELVHFRAGDGLELTGWLYRAAKPGRAVISLHGGPALQETPRMNPGYQALVAAGISVFAPNIRGSAGFGRRFVRLDDGDQRANAIADVKSAAELLIAERIAQPRRIGIMGESYGGWLTLAAMSRHPGLFAAAVDQYGMLDLERMMDEAIPEVVPMLRAEYGGETLLERYSINRKALRTPTLVMHGAQDGIVSTWHATETVAALRANRVPVEYIVFPDEGHGWRKTPNRVRAAVAVTAWFERWL